MLARNSCFASSLFHMNKNEFLKMKGEHMRNNQFLHRHVVPFVVVGLAFGLRFVILGGGSDSQPYVTFYPAVMLAAVMGGIVSGLLATGLSALVVTFFFAAPFYTFSIANFTDALGLMTFLAGGTTMAVVGEVTVRQRERLRRQAHDISFSYESLKRETLSRQEAEKAAHSAEVTLHENMIRQGVTLQAVGDGVISVDTQARVEFLNPIAEKLTGWAQADALGKPLSEVFHIINEDTLAVAEDPVAKALRLGGVVGLTNHTLLITKDGLKIPISDSAAPIVGMSGEIIGVVLVFSDQTEERRATRKLQESAEKAKILAEQSNAANIAKSEFLANMSHEIRTPLNGVIGMLQLIKAGGTPDELEAYTDMALRAGLRLTNLLGDILDLSRIEAGRMAILSQPFMLQDIFTALSETFSPMHFSKPLSFAIRVGPDVPTSLVGDEIRVRQILFNLIGNAIKFTDKGEVNLEVSSLPPPSAGMARLLFMVSDTGIGIPDDKLGQICQPFVQVSKEFTRSQQGAGLGLAITLRLVKAMEGTLTFESTEDIGTTVYLSLPLKLAVLDFAPVAQQKVSDVVALSPLRILLVEDEEISRLSARLALEKRGHHVVTANNGVEALGALRGGTYDCVLMDIQMDVMDGVEATRRIRNGSSGALDSRVPMIAMTAYTMTGDREQFLEVGMDDYVAKPVQVEELLKALERVMRKRGKETQ